METLIYRVSSRMATRVRGISLVAGSGSRVLFFCTRLALMIYDNDTMVFWMHDLPQTHEKNRRWRIRVV